MIVYSGTTLRVIWYFFIPRHLAEAALINYIIKTTYSPQRLSNYNETENNKLQD